MLKVTGPARLALPAGPAGIFRRGPPPLTRAGELQLPRMGRWALDVAFVWRAVLTLGLVLLYYCFSIGITFYNKWLTKVTRGPRQPGRVGGGCGQDYSAPQYLTAGGTGFNKSHWKPLTPATRQGHARDSP